MEKIKVCPCCGHSAKFHQVGPRMIISCTRCGLKLEKMSKDKQSLITCWNQRIN